MVMRVDSCDLLKNILRLSSSVDVEPNLDQVLRSLSEVFGADRCLFLRPEEISRDGFLSRIASEKKPLWVKDGFPFEKEGVLPDEEGLLCPSFVCIPLGDETSFQGILYLGFQKSQSFSPWETDLLLVAEALGGAIRNVHFHLKAQDTISELAALHELGKVVASTLKLDDLLKSILFAGSKLLKARGGALRLVDRKTAELKVRCSLGDYHKNPLDERIAKTVLFTKMSLSRNPSDEENPPCSILCAPLVSSRESIGTLTFYDREGDPSRFDQKDLQLLLTTANQVSSAIENAQIHYETSLMAQEQETRAKQLSTLWELNKFLLTTMNFERIVHMTLTAITMGDGLGYNRAMLFLVNEKHRTLEGTMAVGPDSPEEAGRVWTALSQKKETSFELISQLRSLPDDTSLLHTTVKGIRIPLEQEQCILSRTVLEGKPFNILSRQSENGTIYHCGEGCHVGSEVGCYLGKHLSGGSETYAFATTPLRGKGKVIGVILIDNVYNRQPITEEDLHLLSMFSNQAGLSIENAMLYRNLEEVHRELKEAQTLLIQREKMAALGELSATVAHEIKNPLVCIGGFARRLYRAIPAEAPEKRYSQTIIIEVARLEKILNDILTYTRDAPIDLEECDLRDILEDSLSMVLEGFDGEGIRLSKHYAEGLPRVNGDYQQLKQVFLNLITNARQAMREEGTLSIRIYPILKNGSSLVRVEVEDDGSGIDPDHLHHIFNPFYTTKESSLGLGLPIVYKIVTSHRGKIEVDNRPGKGVTFIITLPVNWGRENNLYSAP